MKNVFLLTLCIFVLTGCETTKQKAFHVNQSSELATMIMLQEIDANEDQAKVVKTTALAVQGILESGVEIDSKELKAKILKEIVNNFDQTEALILSMYVNNLAELILSELDGGIKITIPDGEFVVLVKAASQGVIDGAAIYISVMKDKQ